MTRHAERRPGEIAVWTAKEFGSAQALVYQDALIERINSLASGEAPHARTCEALLYRRLAALGLLYYRAGNHYIIMRETADRLEIVDFLHERFDLAGYIEKLSRW